MTCSKSFRRFLIVTLFSALAWSAWISMAKAQSPGDQAAVMQAAKDSGGIDKFNAADNAWVLTSSALVLMMTAPGLALFYCGLVRRKNVLSVMMQCIFLDVPDDVALGLVRLFAGLWRRRAVDRRPPLCSDARGGRHVDRKRPATGPVPRV